MAHGFQPPSSPEVATRSIGVLCASHGAPTSSASASKGSNEDGTLEVSVSVAAASWPRPMADDDVAGLLMERKANDLVGSIPPISGTSGAPSPRTRSTGPRTQLRWRASCRNASMLSNCSLEPLVRSALCFLARVLSHLTPPGNRTRARTCAGFCNLGILHLPQHTRDGQAALPTPGGPPVAPRASRRPLCWSGRILYESGLGRRIFDFLESAHHELIV